jgi:anaphase-promoting complex subunit 3
VVEVDKMSPEAWCVVGNSFSRQREPEVAIKFFERALAIDPTFTYAHTLSGHELVSSEDLERAQKSFRSAIKCDDRHYNAWYGLGAIYTRQERFEMAEYHFRRALSINASSSVLRCYLGMVLHYQGAENPRKANEALDVLEDAVSRDRSNPQLPFQLAHVLITAGRLEEAKTVLAHLCEVTPREPPVFSLLGQVCQRLGQNQEAYLYYNTAIDLDPREAANLKSAMSSLGAAKDDDDEQGEDETEVDMDVGEEMGDEDDHGDHSGDMDMTTDIGMNGGEELDASGEEEEDDDEVSEGEQEEGEEDDYDGDDAYFDDSSPPQGDSRREL